MINLNQRTHPVTKRHLPQSSPRRSKDWADSPATDPLPSGTAGQYDPVVLCRAGARLVA
jgi:hypothetical protein